MGRFCTLILGMVLLALPAAAQGVLKFGTSPTPIPYIIGPVDPGTQQANLNALIQELNLVLSPVLPATVAALPGVTNITVGPPAGTAGNVGVSIVPTTTGGIILFSQAGTGILEIGSQASFFPAKGLTQCPGVPQGQNPTSLQAVSSTNALIGPGGTVTGFFPVLDWLGRPHYLVTC